MRHTRGQVVEIHSVAELRRRLAAGARSLAGWRLHELDLRDHADVLADVSVEQALFVGCRLEPDTAEVLDARGATVLPELLDAPVAEFPARLYTATDLYDTPAYADSLDARAYAWSQVHDRDRTLVQSLHDHGIDAALEAWVAERTLVGVMGGHALPRGSGGYAAAARLGHRVAASHTVATGGGPGAMEAANLGAWLAPHPSDALEEALEQLSAVPTFTPSVHAWVHAAFAVRERWPGGGESLGVPTWHYGHEPPNPFATAIAKYFRNATREAILLEVCDGGIVFLPGAGGTVQEVFQDACENYYADPGSVAPMVLVGREYWTRTLPVWPLLQALARGRAMEGHVHLVDDVDEVADLLSPA